MSDRRILIEGTRDLLTSISPWVLEVSILSWDGSQGFLPIIRRSILRRQVDSLQIALGLVEAKHGYAAVPLLRPACEELFWLRYINTLSPDQARTLVDCLISTGLLRDLEAQVGEVGPEVMAQLGLSPALKLFRTKQPHITEELKQLGKALHWPSRVVGKGEIPSTWFVAKATNSETLYRFLYHATSRYVHFSAVELARRGWGRPGRLELSSDTYEPIWSLFTLSWGTRLFGWTLQASLDAMLAEGVNEPDHQELQAAFDKITRVALIPLVTADELIWDPKK